MAERLPRGAAEDGAAARGRAELINKAGTIVGWVGGTATPAATSGWSLVQGRDLAGRRVREVQGLLWAMDLNDSGVLLAKWETDEVWAPRAGAVARAGGSLQWLGGEHPRGRPR